MFFLFTFRNWNTPANEANAMNKHSPVIKKLRGGSGEQTYCMIMVWRHWPFFDVSFKTFRPVLVSWSVEILWSPLKVINSYTHHQQNRYPVSKHLVSILLPLRRHRFFVKNSSDFAQKIHSNILSLLTKSWSFLTLNLLSLPFPRI